MAGNVSDQKGIAIIGAGLGGLGAALAFHAQGFRVTIYEQAASSERFAGGIMLSPNALRILDTYGLFDRIKSKGHTFTYVDFLDHEGNSTDHQILGDKKLFGYDALRIYRNTFRDELERGVQDIGIKVQYSKKFIKIVNETSESVTFGFADGTQATSPVLIAADGIWSKIRSVLFPDVVPIYQGFLAVVGACKHSDLVIPPTLTIDGPVSQSSKAGSFLIAPQLPDGGELLAGTQRRFPEQTRAGWEHLAKNRAFQRTFLEEGIEDRSELMQSAIRGIMEGSIYIWALHTLPHLPRWSSEKGRVILIGDAAHAIPPTTGQGANQAFEDGYSLAMLLANKPENVDLKQALTFWQTMREPRISGLLELTKRLNNTRLPAAAQEGLGKEDLWTGGDAEAVRWLYEPKIEEQVMAWVEAQKGRA